MEAIDIAKLVGLFGVGVLIGRYVVPMTTVPQQAPVPGQPSVPLITPPSPPVSAYGQIAASRTRWGNRTAPATVAADMFPLLY